MKTACTFLLHWWLHFQYNQEKGALVQLDGQLLGTKASPASPSAQCYLQLSIPDLDIKHTKSGERNIRGCWIFFHCFTALRKHPTLPCFLIDATWPVRSTGPWYFYNPNDSETNPNSTEYKNLFYNNPALTACVSQTAVS